MFSTIIQRLQATLETVSELEVVYPYPETEVSGYPAAVIYPVRFDNQFHSSAQNFKQYQFAIAVIQETSQAGVKAVYTQIMPGVLDAIMEAIDADWNGNVVDGGRVWYTLETGDWTFTTESPGGPSVTAFLFVTIRHVNDI